MRAFARITFSVVGLAVATSASALPFNQVGTFQHNGTTKVDITDPDNNNVINTVEWGAGPTVISAPGNGVGTYNTNGQGEVVAKLFDNSLANSSGPWGGSSSKTCCNFTPGTTSITVTSSTASYGLVGYTLANGNDSASRRPVAWRLFGSNDNFATPGTLLDQVVPANIFGGGGWTGDNQIGEVVFAAQTAQFNSFRFVFDQSQGNNSDFQLAEIELFGFQGPPPPPPPPPAVGTIAHIGGTIINAPNAEGCCLGGSLFNFNGGTGSITGISSQQVGLDDRSNGVDGVYNGVTNQPATFSLSPANGFDQITGFQVMNSTNAQFDDRQTGQFTIEVSTSGPAGPFTMVVNTTLNTVPGADGAAPLAQEFLIAPIAMNPLPGMNVIRINSVTAFDAGAVSLSEFRTIVRASGANSIPEPASAMLGAMGLAVLGLRRRRAA